MPNYRLSDLTAYKGVLPYASELFGVYQPLIGWKSKRRVQRIKQGLLAEQHSLLFRLSKHLESPAVISLNADCAITAESFKVAQLRAPRLANQDAAILKAIAKRVGENGGRPLDGPGWQQLIPSNWLDEMLNSTVLSFYNESSINKCRLIEAQKSHETEEQRQARILLQRSENEQTIKQRLLEESLIAGVVRLLIEGQAAEALNKLFFSDLAVDAKSAFAAALKKATETFDDPYLTFDPKKDLKDVTLSPLGIVHLYRQFFFELDSFLGTPVGHVWLSPGSTVELLEVSTRRTLVEKTIETEVETTTKTEKVLSTTDEISEAVKQDNKNDLKLGITSTVNQSWGTGNASATASLNMDKTQAVGRENTHKRTREQTEKFATELRQNYKSTFKTVTETTDTSSKRYVLTNQGKDLVNYELRRKMRQVAVQLQDVGSYLCWETFVDEPGEALGLASLVHIAAPADLLPPPDQTLTPYPPDVVVPFQTNAVWNFGDSRQYGFVPLNASYDPPPPPEGYEIVKEPGTLPVGQISASGEDFTGSWAFGAQFTPTGQLSIGVLTAPGGLEWDERVDFVVGGALRYTPSAAKKSEIDTGNKAKIAAGEAVTRDNARKDSETFMKAAKERIEQAGAIAKRRYEDLREEERIIVYRRLIKALMTEQHYSGAGDQSRHVLSELINSIFDIDKMLYFVAPEWWKSRDRAKSFVSIQDVQSKMPNSLVTWSDSRARPDNYLITDKSNPAPMGSSLGWLLQLDGDDLRNAFLNAPWVKAVIPVRPGKEQAAINWLQNVGVEGADGLSANYAAPDAELQKIRTKLGLPAGQVVTIRDAIEFLCVEVAEKHAESNAVQKYPDTEINDDNKVSATPIEKVYEHGFYPLKGGFRMSPTEGAPDPNNTASNFQIFDQWVEVAPTDQVVPVTVEYNPVTGRQKQII